MRLQLGNVQLRSALEARQKSGVCGLLWSDKPKTAGQPAVRRRGDQ